MTRMMMAAGLALAVSAGAAIAADPGKDESGKGRERSARELHFERHEARVGRGCVDYRSHLAYRFFGFFGSTTGSFLHFWMRSQKSSVKRSTSCAG